MPVSTHEYNTCEWRAWLNNPTLTIGVQTVFNSGPHFVAGASGPLRTTPTNRSRPSKVGSGTSS
jgi:hypothetical protein